MLIVMFLPPAFLLYKSEEPFSAELPRTTRHLVGVIDPDAAEGAPFPAFSLQRRKSEAPQPQKHKLDALAWP
jgi:hypothetical protein